MKALIPAVVQCANTGRVLMLAYMNEDAYERTMTSKEVHFFSRKRQAIWKKGESSGHILRLQELWWDCDDDALLVKVNPIGNSCHTGEVSCFHKAALVKCKPMPMDILRLLEERLDKSLRCEEAHSYSEKLLTGPLAQCGKKVIEEAGELALALVSEEQGRVEFEAADLLFHVLVCLARVGVSTQQVLSILAERWQQES